MQYWFLFLAIFIPMLMFRATPASSRLWRMGRSVLAGAVGYGVTLLLFYIASLYFPMDYDRIGWHWLLMGWLWTCMYVGWSELAWRIKHRHALISIRKGLGDDWINGKIMVVALFGTLLFMLIVVAIIVTILQVHGILSR